MNNEYLFTSESVSPGHPDKLSDQLSDAVLDYVFETDKNARVACEVLTKGKKDSAGSIVVAGENIQLNVTVNDIADFSRLSNITVEIYFDWGGPSQNLSQIVQTDSDGTASFDSLKDSSNR